MASPSVQAGPRRSFTKTVQMEADGKTDKQILDCLIETALLTLGAVPGVRNMNFEATKAKFRKLFPWEDNFEVRKAGSTVDLLYLTRFWMHPEDGEEDTCKGIDFNTDIDILFIPSKVFVTNELSEDRNAIAYIEKTDYPSFVKLRYNEACDYKVPEQILTRTNTGRKSYVSSQKLLETMKGYMNVQKPASEICGPSLQIQPCAMKTPRSFLTSADIVFAFKNREWPTWASEWFTRERPNNWPPPSVVEEILSLGSHVVAKSNQLSQEAEVTWRLSFNMAERCLGELMTPVQRKCFLTLKTLVKETRTDALSSYHMKTILWWMLEQGDNTVWENKSIGSCFLSYLDEVIKALDAGVVSNYFIPECNMTEHVDKTATAQLALKLKEVRAKPLSAIISSTVLTENAAEIFSICPVEEYHFQHVEEALLRYRGDDETKKVLLRYFKFHFLNLGSCFVVDPNQREKGISLLKKVAELLDPNFNQTDFVKQELLKATKSALDQNNLEVGLSFFGALLTVIPHKEAVDILKDEGNKEEMLASLFHDTGCVFLNWSITGFWKNQRDNDLQASEDCFKTSIALKPNGQENHAEYAHFLLVQNRSEEAIEYARKSIENTKDSSAFSCLHYSMEDRDAIENSVARHVQYEHGIIVPAVVIAYHVQALAYKNLGRMSEASSLLPNYLEVCVSGLHKNHYEALSVHGYTCMSLGLYREAKRAFFKALEIKQSQLQEENIDICNKVIAAESRSK